MPKAEKLDPETEAERIREEIEEEFPPERCSLEQYRDVLRATVHALRHRIECLNHEIRCRGCRS